MNCKPGDIAIVIRTQPEGEQYLGMMVEVLYAQPLERFQLPDGCWHEPAEGPGSWVLHILGPKRRVEMLSGGYRLTSYGCGRDRALKPLPGQSQDEETREELTA